MKSTIIIGGQSTGKTTKAREIAGNYSPENVVYATGYDLDMVFLSDKILKENTELIVIDEYSYNESTLLYWLEMMIQGVSINRKWLDKVNISPEIILVSNSLDKLILANVKPFYKDHFDIIDCGDNVKMKILDSKKEIATATTSLSDEEIHNLRPNAVEQSIKWIKITEDSPRPKPFTMVLLNIEEYVGKSPSIEIGSYDDRDNLFYYGDNDASYFQPNYWANIEFPYNQELS